MVHFDRHDNEILVRMMEPGQMTRFDLYCCEASVKSLIKAEYLTNVELVVCDYHAVNEVEIGGVIF